MKKIFFTFCIVLSFFSSEKITAQQRYFDEVFSSVSMDSINVKYGKNYSMLTGVPALQDLKLDVYEPGGDTVAARPLIVYLHTGSFLPILYNKQPVGSRSDSASKEMCKQFARRGYVAASIEYRLGWNPLALGAAGQDIRTGTLLQAVYRALQDAKTAVRYFDSLQTVYRVDMSKVVICGQGSGGYVALAYVTLNNFGTEIAGLSTPKFISGITDSTYDFVLGQPFVNPSIMGGFDGLGGTAGNNYPNHPGYSSAVSMAVNMGGAIGDSTWLNVGDVPMVCFHVPNDPFAPYMEGMVVVPTTGDNVVYVSGSYEVIRRADNYGNNSCFNIPYTDPYTIRANQVNNGHEGLFPFVQPDPGIYISPNPFHGQAAPWEWYSKPALYALGTVYGISNASVDTIYNEGLLTNPLMNKARALAYIDSVQGYLAPRIVQALELPGWNAVSDFTDLLSTLSVFPNPSSDYFTVKGRKEIITGYSFTDISGKMIEAKNLIHTSLFTIDCSDIVSGIYLLNVISNEGRQMIKVVVE